jgi:hypothetical protein
VDEVLAKQAGGLEVVDAQQGVVVTQVGDAGHIELAASHSRPLT